LLIFPFQTKKTTRELISTLLCYTYIFFYFQQSLRSIWIWRWQWSRTGIG